MTDRQKKTPRERAEDKLGVRVRARDKAATRLRDAEEAVTLLKAELEQQEARLAYVVQDPDLPEAVRQQYAGAPEHPEGTDDEPEAPKDPYEPEPLRTGPTAGAGRFA